MSDRARILGAVRAALADVPPSEPATWTPAADSDPAAAYRRTTDQAPARLIALFAQRCGEYRATVTRCDPDAAAVRDTVTAVCARHDVRVLAIAPRLDAAWLPDGIETRVDDPPPAPAELDGCDGALSVAALAIAETGTLALDGGAGQGRRALTLVPDLHICVVRAGDIVGSVPEAIARLGAAVADRGAPVTLISGPSATSDIELERVEGVHGPRRLEVIVAG